MTKKTKPNARKTVKSSSLGQWSPSEITTSTKDLICPPSMDVKLRWQYVNNNLSMQTPGTAYSYAALSLNSAYDPLYQIGGGSCTGFAQWMTLYNRYIVTDVVISMRIRNTSATSIGNNIVAFILEVPSYQVTTVGTAVSEDVLETRKCSTKIIPYNTTGLYTTLTRSINIKAVESLPSLIADYSNLSGSSAASPNRQCLALAGVCRPTGSQSGCVAECVFMMEFSVHLYAPRVFETA